MRVKEDKPQVHDVELPSLWDIPLSIKLQTFLQYIVDLLLLALSHFGIGAWELVACQGHEPITWQWNQHVLYWRIILPAGGGGVGIDHWITSTTSREHVYSL